MIIIYRIFQNQFFNRLGFKPILIDQIVFLFWKQIGLFKVIKPKLDWRRFHKPKYKLPSKIGKSDITNNFILIFYLGYVKICCFILWKLFPTISQSYFLLIRNILSRISLNIFVYFNLINRTKSSLLIQNLPFFSNLQKYHAIIINQQKYVVGVNSII